MPALLRRAKAILMLTVVSACAALPQPPTPTPTREFGAPTIVPSPTVRIQTSDELYGSNADDGQNSATAAALPNSGSLPPLQLGTREPGGAESVQIIMSDGDIVVGDLYEPVEALVRVPGVLLLAQDRLAWDVLPAQLLTAGYTVLVAELPPSPRAEDVDVLLTSLSENGTVDPARIAVIGAEQGADLALLGCATVPICDALVLLTPQNRGTLLNVIPNYNPRPLLVAVAESDAEASTTASALLSLAAGGSELLQYPSGSGQRLITQNADATQRILTWLQAVLTL